MNSIIEILKNYGYIEQDALARAFARRFVEEPHRGYAGGATWLLGQIAHGGDWREISPRLFGTGLPASWLAHREPLNTNGGDL